MKAIGRARVFGMPGGQQRLHGKGRSATPYSIEAIKDVGAAATRVIHTQSASQ
jgi:hypothetical protein